MNVQAPNHGAYKTLAGAQIMNLNLWKEMETLKDLVWVKVKNAWLMAHVKVSSVELSNYSIYEIKLKH